MSVQVEMRVDRVPPSRMYFSFVLSLVHPFYFWWFGEKET